MLRYGIDAPFWVFFNLIGGGAFALMNLFWNPSPGKGALVFWGVCVFLVGAFMLFYSTVTKFKHRDRILQAAGVKTGKHVLDVGTGKGLLAIQAAKWGASVVAIDKWSRADLSGNGRKAFLKNAAEEGVQNKVKLFDGDARKLPFQKDVYDAVVSNFVIHNLTKDRETAVKEMWRVLKPGGLLVISDIRGIPEYKKYLEKLGYADLSLKGPFLDTFPFARMLIARKKEKA